MHVPLEGLNVNEKSHGKSHLPMNYELDAPFFLSFASLPRIEATLATNT